MTRKQIEALKSLYNKLGFSVLSPEQALLRCREMINSILIYHYTPEDTNFDFPVNNSYLKDYFNEVGEQVAKLLWEEQVEDYKKAKIGNAGNDFEGCCYNYCIWADD